MLKIHSGGSSSQQTVLTIPANQLKQLGVGSGSGGLQTILMPVGKGRLMVVVGRFELCFRWLDFTVQIVDSLPSVSSSSSHSASST